MTQAMATPVRTFTTSQGRTFAVRILPAGAHQGGGARRVTDVAMVEFYDTTYADDGYEPGGQHGYGPLGQFVTRYTFGTMISHEGGLNLDGGVDVWSVDAATMRQITQWLSNPAVATRIIRKDKTGS
jgi:hypothetical protein